MCFERKKTIRLFTGGSSYFICFSFSTLLKNQLQPKKQNRPFDSLSKFKWIHPHLFLYCITSFSLPYTQCYYVNLYFIKLKMQPYRRIDLEVQVIHSNPTRVCHKNVVINHSVTLITSSFTHSTHSIIQLHVISLHSSTVKLMDKSKVIQNHPLFFNASSWPFFKSSPSACRHFFFSSVLLLISGPLPRAGCDLCCGGVVAAAECLLQQGSLGCCRQVEEGVDQRQQ